MPAYRFVDNQYLRSYDIHADGRKFGFFKDLRYNFAIVEDAAETSTSIIYSDDPDYQAMLDIDAAGDVVVMGFMTSEQVGLWNLAAWFELFLWKDVSGCDAKAVAAGESNDIRIKILTYHLQGHGVDAVTAQSIATDYVTNGTKPSFRNLGLADAPALFSQMLGGRI